jgi:hypothetical protein
MDALNDPIIQYAYIYLEAGKCFFYEIYRSTPSSNSLAYSLYSLLGLVGTEQTVLANGAIITAEGTIAVTAETAGSWHIKPIEI